MELMLRNICKLISRNFYGDDFGPQGGGDTQHVNTTARISEHVSHFQHDNLRSSDTRSDGMSTTLLDACHLICSCLDWEEMTVGDMSVGGVLPECWPVLDESVFSSCSPSLRIVESGSNFPLAFRMS
jgi:hypothetical protein